jgi:hypothetical protein
MFSPTTGLHKRGKKQLYKLARNYIPSIREKVEEQCKTMIHSFENIFLKRVQQVPFLVELPEVGYDDTTILDAIQTHVNMGKTKHWILSRMLRNEIQIFILYACFVSSR